MPSIKHPNDPASQAQIGYVHSLLVKHVVEPKWLLIANKRIENGLSKGDASNLINWLTKQPVIGAAPANAGAVLKVDVQVGVYTLADGTVCKVQKSKTTGGLYALKMQTGHDGKPTFAYVGGLIHQVRATGTPMSLEDACKIGVQTGVCIICNTALSDEKSIRKGIGPVCEKKQGRLVAP